MSVPSVPSVPVDHDSIVNEIIAIVSEQSGHPATLDSILIGELGLDSLDFVQLSQAIETQFGIGPVPDRDLFRLQTVGQVVNYVEGWKAKVPMQVEE